MGAITTISYFDYLPSERKKGKPMTRSWDLTNNTFRNGRKTFC
jgi:hypothetical protein